jgi:hypothetical protein
MSITLGILASSRGTAAPPVGLLLDTYPGANRAYSFRKLNTAYSGSCVRIRRSSDNAEQDFGFVNNYVDITSISTFCGSGNGFIRIWYDQSGNAINSDQGLTGTQPQIYFSGSFLLRSGKICIEFAVGRGFNTPLYTRTAAQNYSFWITYEKSGGTTNLVLWGGGSNLWAEYGQTLQYINNSQPINITPNNYAINTRYLVNNICDTSIVTIYSNNIAWGSRTTSDSAGFNSIAPASTRNGILTIQEFVLYSNSQAANRTAINTNINSFYSIY